MEEKKPLKIKFKTAVIIIVTAVVLLGIGANVYASVNGYGNIFFLIKYLVTGEKTEITGKDELLSDRDITISYEPITLTKDIKLQIRNLQVKNDKANLILLVSESNQNDVTPLKYKVYNSQNKVICEQNSKKSGDITQYTEELKLNEFNNDRIIYLEVDNSKNEKITKITINLETREISVEGEKEAVEKISEIKLKDFLGYVSAFEPNKDSIDEKILFSKAMLKKYDYGESESRYLEIVNLMLESCGYEKIQNSFEPTEYFKPGKYYTVDTIEVVKARGGFEPNKVLEIKDISYCGGIYTVKFNYAFIKEDGTDVNYNDLDIKEATVEFELNTNKDYSEFKVVKFTQEAENEENSNTEMGDAAVYVITVQRFNKLEKIYMYTDGAFELGEYTDNGWKVLNHDEVINNLFTENMKKIYQNRLPNLLQFINNQAYVLEGGGFHSYNGLVSIDIINYTDNTINVSINLKYVNTSDEFLKEQKAEMKLVKQDGKWLIDSFDVTKFYDVPDGAVVESDFPTSNNNTTTNNTINNTTSTNKKLEEANVTNNVNKTGLVGETTYEIGNSAINHLDGFDVILEDSKVYFKLTNKEKIKSYSIVDSTINRVENKKEEITGFNGKVKKVYFYQVGQAVMPESLAILFLMEDGKIEYISYVDALQTNNLRSRGEISGLYNISDIYSASAREWVDKTGGPSWESCIAKDSSNNFYSLEIAFEKNNIDLSKVK